MNLPVVCPQLAHLSQMLSLNLAYYQYPKKKGLHSV